MVEGAIPVARATPVMPPRPAARASVAAHSRRARSVNAGASVLYFARQILTFTHAAYRLGPNTCAFIVCHFLRPINATHQRTKQGVEDWHYWVKMGYEL